MSFTECASRKGIEMEMEVEEEGRARGRGEGKPPQPPPDCAISPDRHLRYAPSEAHPLHVSKNGKTKGAEKKKIVLLIVKACSSKRPSVLSRFLFFSAIDILFIYSLWGCFHTCVSLSHLVTRTLRCGACDIREGEGGDGSIQSPHVKATPFGCRTAPT